VNHRRKPRKNRPSRDTQRPSRSSSRDLTPLRDVLQSLFDDPDLPFNPDDAKIWKVWNDVVGPAIAQNARPSWIHNGRLRVRVSGPIWLQELEFAAETIRDRLNTALGRPAVERIEFRLGDPGAAV